MPSSRLLRDPVARGALVAAEAVPDEELAAVGRERFPPKVFADVALGLRHAELRRCRWHRPSSSDGACVFHLGCRFRLGSFQARPTACDGHLLRVPPALRAQEIRGGLALLHAPARESERRELPQRQRWARRPSIQAWIRRRPSWRSFSDADWKRDGISPVPEIRPRRFPLRQE